MTIQAFAVFLSITTPEGVVQGRYQNAQPGQAITYQGQPYSYLSFIYRGSSRNRTGDNMESQLMLASNALAMNLVQAAVQGRWLAEVSSLTMHPETFEPGRVLARDVWTATGLSYDPESIEVLLSSTIDAVGANAPTRVLTEAMVGQLPVSSSIRNA